MPSRPWGLNTPLPVLKYKELASAPGSHKLCVGDGEKRAWSTVHVHVRKSEGIRSFTDITCLIVLASILSYRMRLRL